ncbi:receptor-type tyrosine-protein phosphatase delta-like isoform X2 [Acropora palmata]|uniref:receptor-type tyrosine-protein phosphatase delta-like isoform X2 n=1 Tax=Acropora palmata TaxID=6131 RepID=UPI003D9FD2BC
MNLVLQFIFLVFPFCLPSGGEQVKPAFTTHPQSQTVREGDNVTLFCNATGTPKPSITWTIDGLTLNVTVHPRISLSSDNKQLTVRNVRRTDSNHEYQCLANNSAEPIRSHAASLTVQYNPALITYPRSQTVREGENATLFCDATGNPRPSISWTIDELAVNITVYSRISLTSDNKQLTVKNVSRTDSHHKYRCQANNSVGTITSDPASLTVQYKPAFTNHPQNKTVREGDTVTLFCNATGNPKPSISWTIDGLTVNITVHPRIGLSSDNKQLTVRNVNRTDLSHEYRCQANNSVGTITSDAASLTDQFKPAFTTHPQNQTVREGDNVTLLCNATGNPKPSISWTIDGLTVNITVHPRISLTSDNKQLTVRNVDRTDFSHKYQCQANNSVGTITSDAASLTDQFKPAFTTHPQNQTVRVGDNVTLFCNATGNPKPTISWTIDGLTVNVTVYSRIRLTSDNKQLTVRNVNRTDSHHKYRCQASNSVKTITSDTASLNVLYKPAFTTYPQNQTVQEGDNVTLFCDATGNPKPTISWTIGGSSLNITVHPRMSLSSYKKHLTVRNVKRTDSHHKYRCQANNSVEALTSDAASLNVQYKPAFTTYPLNQTVREGDNVTLLCDATGNPKPTISWTIDGLTVNIEGQPRISLTSDNKQLTVRNVKRTDSNHQYRCRANNSVETITSVDASLNVQFVPEVTIEGTPEKVAVVGNEIQLTCHYNSSPVAFEVQWLKNGAVISRNNTMVNNTRGNITHFNESSIQLAIISSISSDAANYTCAVFNDVNSSSDTIAIRVKPDPPHNLLISNTTSRTLTISWSAGFDGNSEIISYKVNITQGNQTLEDVSCEGSFNDSSCTVPGVVTNVTLKDLHPFTKYYLRVFAVNEIGQSEASEVVNATTGEEAPSAAPVSLQGHNKSSTSIFVTWGQVPPSDQNGLILSYTVSYTEASNGSAQTVPVTVNEPTNSTTLKDLNQYTNYSITIFASTIKGAGIVSAPIFVITDQDTPSAAPVSLQGHNKSSTSIFVTWGQVPPSDQNGLILSYTVSYTEASNGSAQTVPVTVNEPTNSTTLKDLNQYTNYSITIFASTIKGAGIVSAPIFVITDQDTPSAAPVSLQGHNKSSTSIFVTWGQVPPSDQNGLILSYTVSYTEASNGSAQTVPVTVNEPTNSTTLKDLNQYTNYSITIFASTIKGAGIVSAPIFVITDQDTPSAAPVSLQGHNKSSTSIFVTWGQVPPSDQNGLILSYTVSYTEASNGSAQTVPVTVNEPTNSTTLKDLNQYTNYSITIFASTIKGAGIVSAPIFVITDQDTPSAAPVSLQGHNKSSTSIFVTWGQVPPSDQNGLILSYTVSYTEASNGSAQTVPVTVNEPTNSTTLKDLNQYTNYSITIFASTIKGAGIVSAPIFVITDQDTPSAAPVSLQGHNKSSTSIFVTWGQVPPSDQNGLILSYTVSYTEASNGSAQTVPVTVNEPTNSTTLKDLNQYTNYSITIFASTIKGAGIVSAPIFVITDQDTPSAAPVSLQGHNKSSTSIFVTWGQVPPSDQNGLILSYTVSYTEASNGSAQTVPVTVNEPTNSTTLKDLNQYTNYSITIFASTIKGAGIVSAPIFVITDQDTPSAAPVSLQGHNKSSTSIFVTWGQVPPSDQNGLILSYTVSYTEASNGSAQTVPVTVNEPTNSTTLKDLNQYTNYSITIFASTIKGAGIVSAPIFVITDQDTPSAAPVSLQGHNKSSTSIFVTWGQVPPSDQNGLILSYTVSYTEASNGSAQTVPVTVNEPTHSTTLKDLNQYTNYSITIFASTIKGAGIVSAPIFVITDEDKPNAPPSYVNGHNVSSTRISVSWRQVPFLDQNGVILSYTVTYRALPSGSSKTKNVIAPADQTTLAGLNEYTNYSITVFASTSKGGGNQSTPIVVITDEDKPNAPPSNVRGRNESSTSIFVQWNQVPAQDQNGVILNYTVSYRALTDCPAKAGNFSTLENNFTLTGLNNYTNYSITVFASTAKGSGNVSSPIIVRTDQDVPSNFPDGLKLNDTTSTSILVQWDKVPHCDKNGIITSYTVRYQAISDRTNHGNKTIVVAPLMSANLTDLIINMKYRISVLASTVKGDGPYSSSKVFTTNQSEPGAAPRNVRGNSSRSTTILVWWDEVPVSKQHGEIISYTVFYWKTDGGSQGKEEKEETKNRKVKLIGLQKYTNYTIQVLASTIKGDGPRSDPTTIVRTDQDTPDGSPVITGLTALDSTTVMVEWRPVPVNRRNGIITRYIIWYLHEDEEHKNARTKEINASALNATITGLRQKARYSFKIRAATSKGEGPLSGANVTETEAVPKAGPLPTDRIGTATAEIQFDTREYLTNGKKVRYYQVIVVQLKEGQDAGNPADPKYKNVRANYEQKKDGEPYITAEFSRKDARETFTIGDDKYYSKSGVTESRRKRRETAPEKYLNGKLEDGTETAAFQRSFDATGFYEDGNLYTFKTSNDPTLAIVLSIVIVLMIAVIVVGIFIYRRRRQNSFKGDEDEGMPMNETSRGGKASSKRNRMSDNPNHSPGETIPVEEFEGHVRRLRANGDLLFSQEYSALRPTSNYTWNATLAQENRFKNRYNNIVAYDHSRVKLNPISNAPGSDYINANYLDGYARKRAYIATQGPLPETADDFWRMVWEQNTKTIVMVTNLEEKGRVKCFQYWPSEGGETHGDIQVQLTETVELSDFTIRKFCLKKSNSRAERMVSQYHYTIWPDHGVPSCPTSVLTFVRKASGSNPPDAGPMVVHCSAGVGRTGTFIVVDAMLQRIAAEKTVDVFGYVMSLRCDRNIMVQVEEQYVFIHEVLLEAIHSGYTEVRASDLRSHIKNLMQVNQNSGQSEMEEEFTRLGRGVAAPQSKFQAANMPYNKTKNRYANVLAFDDSRVKLSVITGIEGSDYINASFVDGYMMRRAFIATQAPIPDTIPDFWRMIWEQESSTVVMLSKETESGKVKVHRYWPAKQPANIGNLVVEMTNEMVYDDYTMRDIKLTNTKESASRVIRQYHYTGWPDVGSPDSGTGLIDLIGQVQRWQQQSGDTTVTVHCSAGVGRTGVFCALSILIERLKSEGVVDVFQTVKQLRAQRPAMVQTKEQYEFIYFALREYLDSFDAYSNFE